MIKIFCDEIISLNKISYKKFFKINKLCKYNIICKILQYHVDMVKIKKKLNNTL